MSPRSAPLQATGSGGGARREILAGATTFASMAYIIVVNPKILEAAGMPFAPAMTATILAAAFGTLLMGLYARRPFAVAPYMGENAFIAFTVVGVLGYTWQQALAAVFAGGVLFTLLSLGGARKWLAESIPANLKIAFAAGIGLFLTFIGLVESGLVVLGAPGAPVHVGDLAARGPLLAIVCFILTIVLMQRRVPGALLIGILATSLLGFATRTTPLPESLVSLPPSPGAVAWKLDFSAMLDLKFLPVVLTVFVMDFVDTMGTLLGVAYKADMLDADGNLPGIEKPMLCDSLATVGGALLGTSTCGTFIESAAGVEAGGRRGLTAVSTAALFLAALFLAPLFGAIPAYAYGPILVVVGMAMLAPLRDLDFDDLTETAPAFVTIVLMVFTYNLGLGMTAGFLSWPLLKTLCGRARDVNPGMWVMGGIALVFYLFYPY